MFFKNLFIEIGILQLDTICICKTQLCVTNFHIEGMNDRDDEQLGILQLDPIYIVGKLSSCVTRFYIKGI
jgi:hypothetical protein